LKRDKERNTLEPARSSKLKATHHTPYNKHHTGTGSNLDKEEIHVCARVRLLKRTRLQFLTILTNKLYYCFTNIISYLCIQFYPETCNILHYFYDNECTLNVTYFVAVSFTEILVSAP
jgi:hypothetical protein